MVFACFKLKYFIIIKGFEINAEIFQFSIKLISIHDLRPFVYLCTFFGAQSLGWIVGISPIDYSRVLVIWGGVPFVWIFLKDPSPHLREFRRKPWERPKD